MRMLKVKRTFWKEFRRQIRFALVAGVGFTVAFAWRNAVLDTFTNFVSRILDVAPDHFLTETYTALAVTLAGVGFIFLTSNLLKD